MLPTPELPPELWIKILGLAAKPRHPGEIDEPVLDWHTPHRLLHRSSMVLCSQAQANKAAMALVCSQWNAIVTASLYEHIRVDAARISSLASLTRVLDTYSPQGPTVRRGAFVKRLDLELIDSEFGPYHPRNTEGLDPSCFDSIVRLLPLLPNLTTLLILLPSCDEPKALMDAIPHTIKRFYWKAAGKTPMSIHRILAFLDTHPYLTSVAFPEFNTSTNANIANEFSADWISKPRPLIQEWVLREAGHSFSVSYLCYKELFPGLVSRSIGYLVDIPQPGVPDWVNTDFSLSVSPMVVPSGGGRMVDTIHPNPTIVRISVLEAFQGSWPTQGFSKKLHIMKRQCPNAKELHLTLAGNMTSNSDRAVKEMRTEAIELQGITSLSLLRISNEWPVTDPLESLHYILRIPWTQTFPNLQVIRVVEEIDIYQARCHPSLGFARTQEWSIRVENRFGESLV